MRAVLEEGKGWACCLAPRSALELQREPCSEGQTEEQAPGNPACPGPWVTLLAPGPAEGRWRGESSRPGWRPEGHGLGKDSLSRGLRGHHGPGGRIPSLRVTWPLPLLQAPSFLISYFLPSPLTRL